MMMLINIVGNFPATRITGDLNIPITGLQFDSRKVQPGNLFFAISGITADGHSYIDTAIENGAVAIVCEHFPEILREGITYILAPGKSSEALGIMASRFYGDPSGKLKLIGITGTNGKTTTATVLHRLFCDLGFGTGLISTITNKINQTEIPASHTTPDPLQINSLLSSMVETGCDYCFMEVSSHAVDQRRISGLFFSGGVFTNLTHDHLDYHKTFDAYLKAKKAFFDQLPDTAFALVNKDDKNGGIMVQSAKASVHKYSLRSMADFHGRILENQIHGLHLILDGQEGWFKLTGRFNAYNLLSVYATAVLLGQDKTNIVTLLSRMEPVSGRFNCLMSPGQVTGIIDYAHTPDALKNVLETINEFRTRNEQLITVIGAGGNRDAAKRPVMARIAAQLSDRVILTSDNPRNEDPGAILAEMQSGVEAGMGHKVLVIENRREAIKTACALAIRGDIILVAGKGHETYQEINGVRTHFDDRETLMEIFESNHVVNR